MTDQPTPETDAMLASDPPSDWPAFARALEIQRNSARADVALITAENERLATGNHSMEKEIPELRRALEKALAERDRLRAALDLIAVPMRPDGTYNRDRGTCGSIARGALASLTQ